MPDTLDQPDAIASRLAAEVIRLRLSMMAVNDLIKARSFSIPVHLALGHEAIAVALADVMGPEDRLLLTHRNIHYNMARNVDLKCQIDEYHLLAQGLGGGRYGSMNLINPGRGISYTSSILGNCLPVAVGVAKALAVSGKKAATIAVTGDGALEEGAFYEALMMATSLSLPVLFLIENNDWSMYTRIADRRCAMDVGSLAAAFGLPYQRLEGNNAAGYRKALDKLRGHAIDALRPAVVEVFLSTLGDWNVDEADGSSRHINYHHGGVPWLEAAADPVLVESDQDPVHVAASQIPRDDWQALVARSRMKIGEALG